MDALCSPPQDQIGRKKFFLLSQVFFSFAVAKISSHCFHFVQVGSRLLKKAAQPVDLDLSNDAPLKRPRTDFFARKNGANNFVRQNFVRKRRSIL
jgi:hypothetical protein